MLIFLSLNAKSNDDKRQNKDAKAGIDVDRSRHSEMSSQINSNGILTSVSTDNANESYSKNDY